MSNIRLNQKIKDHLPFYTALLLGLIIISIIFSPLIFGTESIATVTKEYLDKSEHSCVIIKCNEGHIEDMHSNVLKIGNKVKVRCALGMMRIIDEETIQ